MFDVAHNYLDSILRRMVNANYISRWMILCIDLLLSMIAISWCYMLDTQLYPREAYLLPNYFLLASTDILVSLLYFSIFKTYSGIIRYSSFHEVGRILLAVFSITLSLYALGRIGKYYSPIFISLILKNATLIFIMLVALRYLIVHLYSVLTEHVMGNGIQRGVIYGIESQSVALANLIQKKGFQGYKVVGFLCRDKSASHQRILDLPVYYIDDDFQKVMCYYKINALIFAIKGHLVAEENDIVKQCINLNIKILSLQLPKMSQGFCPHNGHLNKEMGELLGRDEIQIDMAEIRNQIEDKVILITGAAGSIGSELTRQLATFHPKKLILFDAAETPLNTLQLEMEKAFPNISEAVLGDVRIKNRLEYVFKEYHPQIIYHAAAYKHVPIVEKNPCEAILTNVLGTRNLANYSIKFSVDKFVMISTDKAVNPSNVMGASKRIAEIYIQALANRFGAKNKIEFITTRFGNVLGSNGSVIPLFRDQIEQGGPVTVTHPDIIRYFMTIPEACQLVLEASVMGNNGEIYVFDMGQPVKIANLAKRMIEMAGFIPGKDILIQYTGLREGEKLYEELLNDKETTQATPHPKIMVAKVREYEIRDVIKLQNELITKAMMVDVKETVKKMKEIVPEFKSMNSIYEQLDK